MRKCLGFMGGNFVTVCDACRQNPAKESTLDELFGRGLSRSRKRQRLSYADAAARIGCSERTLRYYEAGEVTVPAKAIAGLDAWGDVQQVLAEEAARKRRAA